jgi:hypothetical protein
MDLLEFAVNRGLALQVLTVQPLDQLMGRLLAVIFGVVPVAEQELAVRRGVLPDSPAAWLVAVVLLDQLVDGGADRAEDAELFNVRAEPGPEPVVGSGLIDSARVYLEPVADLASVHDPQDDGNQSGEYQASHDGRAQSHHCSPTLPTAAARACGVSR